ncbi:MAG: UvrD-helicase domain-containing protein [Chlamydiales bacterium]|nr:UvrD-helicase domain-containing protein [Chlamydiales bacterium]
MTFDQLNQPQKKGVTTTEGRVLVLAGAGSGKTRVITYRIAHLIKDKKVPASSILGLTFTNKAAQEMKHRAAKLIGKDAVKDVTLCTFHSFCMQVLRSDIEKLGYTNHFSLYDERDVRRLIQQLARLHFDGDEMPSLEPTIEAIRYVRSRGLTAAELPLQDALTLNVYTDLAQCMRAYNAVDFDSLIILTVELFNACPDVLKKYQDQFRYIMIDEYQDTNDIQFELAELLTGPNGNLCVVGDDDQSIYSWRGAEVKHILNFKADHIVKLEENYRSTKTILNAAASVIANNEHRHDKTIFSAGSIGTPIEVFHTPTELDEARSIIERLLHFKNQGYAWSDMAILYRTNILARNFEIALMEASWKREDSWVRGIPYQIFGGTELYERSEVKDLMAYLRVISNPQDAEAILRIINTPRRGIAASTLDKITSYNRSENIPLWHALQNPPSDIAPRAKSAISSFVHTIKQAQEDFKSKPLDTALRDLILSTDYKRAIEEEVKSEKMRAFKMQNVTEVVQTLKDQTSLRDFLSTSMLNRNPVKDRHHKQTEDRVNMLTFHSAKGLEFPVCFLVGLEDHILPHDKREGLNEIEEERRLFYVAITRAKEHLTLSMSRNRKRYGKDTPSIPSRFLFEIPKELMKVVPFRKVG